MIDLMFVLQFFDREKHLLTVREFESGIVDSGSGNAAIANMAKVVMLTSLVDIGGAIEAWCCGWVVPKDARCCL